MRHVVEWPGGEWLNKDQAQRAMGIPMTMFDRLLDLGVLPPAQGDNPKVKLWHWAIVFAVAQLWPTILPLIACAPEGGEEPKPPPKK